MSQLDDDFDEYLNHVPESCDDPYCPLCLDDEDQGLIDD